MPNCIALSTTPHTLPLHTLPTPTDLHSCLFQACGDDFDHLVAAQETKVVINVRKERHSKTLIQPSNVTCLTWMQCGDEFVLFVGLDTGAVRCFDAGGTLLSEQTFHNGGPVSHLKVHRNEATLYSGTCRDLIVAYCPDGVVCHVFAEAIEELLAQWRTTPVEETPLVAYKKWNLQTRTNDVRPYSDVVVCDRISPLTEQPFCDSYRRSRGSNSVHFLAVGEDPTIAYFEVANAYDNVTAMSLVREVGSQIVQSGISYLRGRIFGAESAMSLHERRRAQESTLKDAAPERVPRRNLYGDDARRHIETVRLSPDRRYAVTTDTLGRVFLLDMRHCAVIKMWKGYRNAQCAWLQHKTEDVYRGLFLVIYVPKRGLLEVWLAERGPRIGAKNIGEGCALKQLCRDDQTSLPHGACPNDVYIVRPNGAIERIVITEDYLAEDAFQSYRDPLGDPLHVDISIELIKLLRKWHSSQEEAGHKCCLDSPDAIVRKLSSDSFRMPNANLPHPSAGAASASPRNRTAAISGEAPNGDALFDLDPLRHNSEDTDADLSNETFTDDSSSNEDDAKASTPTPPASSELKQPETGKTLPSLLSLRCSSSRELTLSVVKVFDKAQSLSELYAAVGLLFEPLDEALLRHQLRHRRGAATLSKRRRSAAVPQASAAAAAAARGARDDGKRPQEPLCAAVCWDALQMASRCFDRLDDRDDESNKVRARIESFRKLVAAYIASTRRHHDIPETAQHRIGESTAFSSTPSMSLTEFVRSFKYDQRSSTFSIVDTDAAFPLPLSTHTAQRARNFSRTSKNSTSSSARTSASSPDVLASTSSSSSSPHEKIQKLARFCFSPLAQLTSPPTSSSAGDVLPSKQSTSSASDVLRKEARERKSDPLDFRVDARAITSMIGLRFEDEVALFFAWYETTLEAEHAVDASVNLRIAEFDGVDFSAKALEIGRRICLDDFAPFCERPPTALEAKLAPVIEQLALDNPSHVFGEAAKFCHDSPLLDHAMSLARASVRALANLSLSATTGILTIRGEETLSSGNSTSRTKSRRRRGDSNTSHRNDADGGVVRPVASWEDLVARLFRVQVVRVFTVSDWKATNKGLLSVKSLAQDYPIARMVALFLLDACSSNAEDVLRAVDEAWNPTAVLKDASEHQADSDYTPGARIGVLRDLFPSQLVEESHMLMYCGRELLERATKYVKKGLVADTLWETGDHVVRELRLLTNFLVECPPSAFTATLSFQAWNSLFAPAVDKIAHQRIQPVTAAAAAAAASRERSSSKNRVSDNNQSRRSDSATSDTKEDGGATSTPSSSSSRSQSQQQQQQQEGWDESQCAEILECGERVLGVLMRHVAKNDYSDSSLHPFSPRDDQLELRPPPPSSMAAGNVSPRDRHHHRPKLIEEEESSHSALVPAKPLKGGVGKAAAVHRGRDSVAYRFADEVLANSKEAWPPVAKQREQLAQCEREVAIAVNTRALAREKVAAARHVLAVLAICVRVKLRPRFDQIFPEYLESRGKFSSDTEAHSSISPRELNRARQQFCLQMCAVSSKVAFEIAPHFDIDADVIRRENVRQLFEEFDDARALKHADEVRDRLALAELLFPVARHRMRVFLETRVAVSPEFQSIKALIPGDVWQWIMRDKDQYEEASKKRRARRAKWPFGQQRRVTLRKRQRKLANPKVIQQIYEMTKKVYHLTSLSASTSASSGEDSGSKNPQETGQYTSTEVASTTQSPSAAGAAVRATPVPPPSISRLQPGSTELARFRKRVEDLARVARVILKNF